MLYPVIVCIDLAVGYSYSACANSRVETIRLSCLDQRSGPRSIAAATTRWGTEDELLLGNGSCASGVSVGCPRCRSDHEAVFNTDSKIATVLRHMADFMLRWYHHLRLLLFLEHIDACDRNQ